MPGAEGTGIFAETAMRAQQFEISEADVLEFLVYFEMLETLQKVLVAKKKVEPLKTIMERTEAAAEGL